LSNPWRTGGPAARGAGVFGLTEGDPRSLPGALSLANSRPIFGRSATFSIGWKF
jgi:hypothetical protein